jgi:hypothetical protein
MVVTPTIVRVDRAVRQAHSGALATRGAQVPTRVLSEWLMRVDSSLSA